MKDTPFKTSGRVSGGEFFGRTETIRTILRNLRGGSNVAIVGPSQIGRTSLATILFRNYKRAEPDALTWFTDMRELNTLDDLVEEFYIATGSRAENHSLVTLLNSLKEFDRRLVIFFDSAERFAEPPFNEEALFALLSANLQRRNISVCLTTTLSPELILKNRMGFPLHSLFFSYELLPLAPTECEELIEKKLRWTGIHFSAAEVEQLIAASQGHPAVLQRMAGDLFRQKMVVEQKSRFK